MSYRAHFIASLNVIRYIGYGYSWRFSDARLVQAATSDRARLGGKLLMRCHALCHTNSES
ncbi:hypothetical protein GCM10011382_01000 [Vreelandella lutescens]|uniref:Uncharacterized protein n=1 Tax=Vreelandella lutescens TaxID=1602943 RepID=A0ABQ1NHP9_9GAMM|nr:hypothetical protein GCM10011382_01000 [Halomonas lutescens]